MRLSVLFLLAVIGFAGTAPYSYAQKAPEAGYIFPAGGKAGTTIDVKLGGYDWTPDADETPEPCESIYHGNLCKSEEKKLGESRSF